MAAALHNDPQCGLKPSRYEAPPPERLLPCARDKSPSPSIFPGRIRWREEGQEFHDLCLLFLLFLGVIGDNRLVSVCRQPVGWALGVPYLEGPGFRAGLLFLSLPS